MADPVIIWLHPRTMYKGSVVFSWLCYNKTESSVVQNCTQGFWTIKVFYIYVIIVWVNHLNILFVTNDK